MAIEITMPQLSDTMSDGTILAWLKKEGESVGRGDALAEVSTDKADLEIESFHQGTLLKIFKPEGTKVNVGEVIAVIGEPGEKLQASPQKSNPVPKADPVPAAEPSKIETQKSNPVPNANAEDSRVKISPLAKNLAKSKGLDYSALQGSGDGGRIVKKDVEQSLVGASSAAVVQARPSTQPQSTGLVLREPLSSMRQAIAARMQESTSTIPHFYVTVKIQVDELKKFRETLKPLVQYEGITFNHIIIKAVGLALRKHLRINSRYENAHLVQPQDVNVGIVTALPDGLLIPVIKQADVLPLSEIVSEARGLVQRARAGRPKSDDLTSGTFSISNMGPFGIDNFTAIINPSQGAILAVSSIVEEPVIKGTSISIGSVMNCTLSVDHRIIDGLMAGEFLKDLKEILENPVLLLA